MDGWMVFHGIGTHRMRGDILINFFISREIRDEGGIRGNILRFSSLMVMGARVMVIHSVVA